MAELRSESRWGKFWRRRHRWIQLVASLAIAVYFSFSTYWAWDYQAMSIGTRRSHWLLTTNDDPTLFWVFLGLRLLIAVFGIFATLLAIAQLRHGIDAATPSSRD